jgi:hypothetical protein
VQQRLTFLRSRARCDAHAYRQRYRFEQPASLERRRPGRDLGDGRGLRPSLDHALDQEFDSVATVVIQVDELDGQHRAAGGCRFSPCDPHADGHLQVVVRRAQD